MLQILNKYSARIALSEVRSLSHKGRGQRIGQILDEYWANIFLLLGKYSTDVGLILDKYWKNIGQVRERHTIYFFWGQSMTFCPTALLPFPKWATTLKKLCQVEIVTILVQKWTQKWNSSKDYEFDHLRVPRDVGGCRSLCLTSTTSKNLQGSREILVTHIGGSLFFDKYKVTFARAR